MEIQNKGFNEFCLLQLGRTISKEELESILNQIIQDINKLHVVNFDTRKVAIEVIKSFIEAMLKNEKIDIEKEAQKAAQKAAIDVLKEIGKMKAQSQEEKRFVNAICEYIKSEIG